MLATLFLILVLLDFKRTHFLDQKDSLCLVFLFKLSILLAMTYFSVDLKEKACYTAVLDSYFKL